MKGAVGILYMNPCMYIPHPADDDGKKELHHGMVENSPDWGLGNWNSAVCRVYK